MHPESISMLNPTAVRATWRPAANQEHPSIGRLGRQPTVVAWAPKNIVIRLVYSNVLRLSSTTKMCNFIQPILWHYPFVWIIHRSYTPGFVKLYLSQPCANFRVWSTHIVWISTIGDSFLFFRSPHMFFPTHGETVHLPIDQRTNPLSGWGQLLRNFLSHGFRNQPERREV